jgi:hypothetical protein
MTQLEATSVHLLLQKFLKKLSNLFQMIKNNWKIFSIQTHSYWFSLNRIKEINKQNNLSQNQNITYVQVYLFVNIEDVMI